MTLAVPGYAGILAFTLAEALWLAADHDDVVLGYPTADRTALAALAADEAAARRVTLMIDEPAQVDLVDAVAAPGARPVIRVAVEADASWRAPATAADARTAGHSIEVSPEGHPLGNPGRAEEPVV